MSNAPVADPTTLYFEDYTPDFTCAGGSYLVSQEEILEFGRRFDPQPFHTDPVAAESGPFGGLIAPGSLTFAIRNALYNQLPVRPALVAGLGLERLDLPTPVRPGDRLTIRIAVVETRRSRSKPTQGIVTLDQKVVNQSAETVLSMTSKMIVRAREDETRA